MRGDVPLGGVAKFALSTSLGRPAVALAVSSTSTAIGSSGPKPSLALLKPMFGAARWARKVSTKKKACVAACLMLWSDGPRQLLATSWFHVHPNGHAASEATVVRA